MTEKKKDRSFVISLTVVAVVLALLLFILFVLPTLSAKLSLEKILRGFDRAVAKDAVEVFDPTYDGGVIPTDASVVLQGEDMLSLCGKLMEVTEGANYSETRRTLAGSWDISVSLRTDDGEFTVYFDENKFYVSKGTKQYVFTPHKDNVDSYTEFYEGLERMLVRGV